MRIENTRFGTIEIKDEATITLPAGLIGFANETRFALIEGGGRIAYLLSLDTPHLAMPVIAGAEFGMSYLTQAGDDDTLMLVPVAVIEGEDNLRANLLAPIVINAKTRSGAQIVLDPAKYSASTLIPTKTANETATIPTTQTTPRMESAQAR